VLEIVWWGGEFGQAQSNGHPCTHRKLQRIEVKIKKIKKLIKKREKKDVDEKNLLWMEV